MTGLTIFVFGLLFVLTIAVFLRGNDPEPQQRTDRYWCHDCNREVDYVHLMTMDWHETEPMHNSCDKEPSDV